ncbi:MAG TPA: glycosyltransferase family 9 protein [Opitutaceae bacterium]|nr:glycosyltransferase family 9 protein [Opitutaceae bacterium]
MRILVSKPDSFGDQLIIAGALQALARNIGSQGVVIWHVRPGMECVAEILEGVSVFLPQTQATPHEEALRLQQQHAHGLVMVPFPLHAFAEWTSETDRLLEWWVNFITSQPWSSAVAAVGNRTWVAEVTVAVSRAPIRVGAIANAARQTPVNAAGALLGNASPLFTVELPFDLQAIEADALIRLLRALPGFPPGDSFPAKLHPDTPPLDQDSPHVVLAPGVGGPASRAWPIQHFQSLASLLSSEGKSVLWLEGPADATFFAALKNPLLGERRILGAHELKLLVSILRSSSALICNDTGYAHLAAVLNVPTLSLFGGGQRRRFHPQSSRVKVLQSLPACAGCQWHCVYTSYPCISDIPVSAVHAAFNDLILRQDTSCVQFVPDWPAERSGEGLVATLQKEILLLDADRFARLQIIQTLLDQQRHPTPVAPPPPPRNAFTVVVPMGRPERAIPTLQALTAQNSPGDLWDVVVAGAGEHAIPSSFPGLRLQRVVLAQRGNPAETRIAGVTLASGEWLVFVDDDIHLSPDFLSQATQLIQRLSETPEGRKVAALGARLPGKTGRFWERVTDVSNFWSQQARLPRDATWLYSAALLVRADAYHAVGGFNPTFAVCEDVDLCQRLVQGGYTLRYEPSLVAYHDHRRDTPLRMWRYFWNNGAGAKFFFKDLGGVTPFSLKTVWRKTWSDLRMNQAHQKANGERLGTLTPWVWLNYLIVETSLEWHWQRHLREERRYQSLPAHARSDRTARAAFTALDAGQRFRGLWQYLKAMGQDFSNPVRR